MENYFNQFDDKVSEMVTYASQKSPAFAARLRSAGLKTRDFANVADLSKLPVLRKDDVSQLQRENPPFGGLLMVDPGTLRRVYQSPGPINEPEPDVEDYWRWKPALEALGVQRGDVVFNALSYHLTPGGAMIDAAARAIGAVVIPGGVGNLGNQLEAICQFSADTYLGTPSYLKALLDKAQELGFNVPLRRAFVSAEPLPPSLRELLESHGLSVRQGYGTAETGNLGYECEAVDGWHVPGDALVQVCDPENGESVDPGVIGEVIVTLFNPYYALIRFGTGDLSSWMSEPCACGRSTPRLAGWQGRIGDGIKVRGMFLHPRQITALMARYPEIERYQFVVTRHDHADFLRCRVMITPGMSDPTIMLERAIPNNLKFKATIELVQEIADGAPVLLDERDWSR